MFDAQAVEWMLLCVPVGEVAARRKATCAMACRKIQGKSLPGKLAQSEEDPPMRILWSRVVCLAKQFRRLVGQPQDPHGLR